MAKKPLEIDMCAGSQLRDTQGEMLSVEGADISDLLVGKGRINDNHGKGFFNSIGRITGAKKIFKAEDCEDDRHRYYWEKVKAPYIYVKAYLYDDEDHPNAKAAAAILRNIHKADVPLKLKASVEGGVVSRGISDPSLLARTKIHSVALTFTPANNATLVEPTAVNKSRYDEAADMELIKSVIHLAENNVPSFRHIARDASANKIVSNIEKIAEYADADPSSVPTKEEILQYALECKIESNINKIHNLIKQASTEEVEKSLKNAMLGAAALGTSITASPTVTQAKVPQAQVTNSQNKSNSAHVDHFSKFGSRNPILAAIGQKESTGGKFYNKHQTVTDPKSMHNGMTAGGTYAIMPLTAQDTFRVSRKLREKYPEAANLMKDVKSNHGNITSLLNSDPKLGYDIARTMINYHTNELKKEGIEPTEDMLIYAHNHGLGATKDAIKRNPASVGSDEYVVEAKKRRATTVPKLVRKSLTAGYGGAGAPGALTGGGVLQSESIDDGRKGFKYVTCDDCGKEQVYAKHQVKCRECGKSWSLAKLHKVMNGGK